MKDYEIEIELTKLMQELQKVSIDLETTLAPFSRLMESTSKNMEQVSRPFDEKSEEIQNKITTLALIRKESLKTGSGNITYIKAAKRRSWNLDALDNICEIDEYVKENIWKFREEKEGDPQVRINVNKKGISVTDI